VRVLGIDPGTITVGYGIIDEEDGRLEFVSCGAVRAKRGMSLAERLRTIHDGLRDVIAGFNPSAAAVEEAFCGKNVRAALRIGEGRGVAILAASSAGIEVAEYSPAVIKRAVVGNGAAGKAQVQQMIVRILSLDFVPEPEDAADALAVAICHCNRAGRSHGD